MTYVIVARATTDAEDHHTLVARSLPDARRLAQEQAAEWAMATLMSMHDEPEFSELDCLLYAFSATKEIVALADLQPGQTACAVTCADDEIELK